MPRVELSRVILAVEVILRVDNDVTFIFDELTRESTENEVLEVDLAASLAASTIEIIVVTHLASCCFYYDHHLYIEVGWPNLDPGAKIELARMMSGDAHSEAATSRHAYGSWGITHNRRRDGRKIRIFQVAMPTRLRTCMDGKRTCQKILQLDNGDFLLI